MDILYENIKKIRESKGWTQEELALKIGYSGRASISAIEKGKVNLPASKIKQIAEIFGMTTDALLGSEDLVLMPTNIEKLIEEAKTCTDEELSAALDVLKAFNSSRLQKP